MIKFKKSRALKKRQKAKKYLGAMIEAAVALGCLSERSLEAQTAPVENALVRFKYAHYKDYQPGEDRMKVLAPMVWMRAPVGERSDIDMHYVYDSMSGASPFYLDTLSGASGTGIIDHRNAGDMKFTRYFERFSVGVGGAASSEDDYLSRNVNSEISAWTKDKNTIFTLGGSYTWDDISSTQDASIDETRYTDSYLLGVTQVINERSIIQSNITFSSGHGDFTDHYKPLDLRPRTRDQLAWLTRYNLYFAESESSLHIDYRAYFDSWSLNAHTVEVAWYKPLGSWLIRPSIRYYTQDKANFFTSDFPPTEFPTGIISADQRLSSFGGFTFGLKVIKELPQGFSVEAAFNYLVQNTSLSAGSGSDNIEPFFANIAWIGVSKTFN